MSMGTSFNKADSFFEYSKAYSKHLSHLLDTLDRSEMDAFFDVIFSAGEKGSTIYFLGNGGSAATASHFVNDLCKYAGRSGIRFKAHCLTDNISLFSALANDEGYSSVFVRQLENLLKAGDVVVGISASGNSENIIKAFDYSKKTGAATFALVGFDGGKMKKMADHCVYVRTENGEYGPVEDIHMILDHMLCSYIALQKGMADR